MERPTSFYIPPIGTRVYDKLANIAEVTTKERPVVLLHDGFQSVITMARLCRENFYLEGEKVTPELLKALLNKYGFGTRTYTVVRVFEYNEDFAKNPMMRVREKDCVVFATRFGLDVNFPVKNYITGEETILHGEDDVLVTGVCGEQYVMKSHEFSVTYNLFIDYLIMLGIEPEHMRVFPGPVSDTYAYKRREVSDATWGARLIKMGSSISFTSDGITYTANSESGLHGQGDWVVTPEDENGEPILSQGKIVNGLLFHHLYSRIEEKKGDNDDIPTSLTQPHKQFSLQNLAFDLKQMRDSI